MDERARLAGETVELLPQLIRNRCVNDGESESGEEVRNVDLLADFLGDGVTVERFEPTPGRSSLVARLEGKDAQAPSVCLMGHTDVVPVNAAGWREDPFGGELIDGEIWGRGAVDMLNVTASMAVVFRHLARSGVRPRGTLIYLAVADEEAGGKHGAEYLIDHHYDAVGADYVLTEFGGLRIGSGEPATLSLTVGEKGISWRRLRIKGVPGHGSMPFGGDNAVVKAAEVVRRLADYRPRAQIQDHFRKLVDALKLPGELRDQLLDPERIMDLVSALPPGTSRFLHACTHTTFSPNVSIGGSKVNVVPDQVHIDLDIRTLPGETREDVEEHLRQALGDLHDQVELEILRETESTSSPVDTPMWKALERAAEVEYPGATVLPSVMTGCTDARFYRMKGAVAYGAALFSKDVDASEFSARFHGHDERVDLRSLELTTGMWLDVCQSTVGGLPE